LDEIDIDDKGKLYLWDGDDVTLTPTLTLNTVELNLLFLNIYKSKVSTSNVLFLQGHFCQVVRI
jgi:hypothetical protein